MIRHRAYRRGVLVLAAVVLAALGAGPAALRATAAEGVAAEGVVEREAEPLAAQLRSGYALAVG